MNQSTPDFKLIKGLLAQDNELIRELYDRLRPGATKIILQLGGQESDVNDMLQEAIIALYVNLRKNQYQQHANVKLSSYVLQIVKFQWLNTRKKAHVKNEILSTDNHEIEAEVNIHEDIENLERNQQLRLIINQLSAKCQRIFEKFYWKKLSLKIIAEQLSINAASAKNAKYRCMQEVKNLWLSFVNKKEI